MARIDIRSVDIRRAALPEGGVPPYGTNPLLVKCPHHEDDSESLAIYCDHIACFGCSFRVGKRMEALAYLLKLPSWKEALEVAPNYRFLTETEQQTARQRMKVARKPTWADVGVYERILGSICSDRVAWLHSRGLSDQTIRTARLGHNGAAFVIPVFDSSLEVVTLRYRNDEEICGKYDEEFDEEFNLVRARKIPKYRGYTGWNDACLYPAWKFEADRRDYVVLVEGEMDALLLWQNGIPALTCTNGASQQGQILALIRQHFDRISRQARRRPALKRIVICGDRDEPGIKAARGLFEQAKQEYEEVIWCQWPIEWGKDITDACKSGHTFEEIYEQYGFDYEATEESSTPADPARPSRHDADPGNPTEAATGGAGPGGLRVLAPCG